MEKIMSEINLFNRWKVKKTVFWGVVAGVPALCIVGFLLLVFIAPTAGRADYSLAAPEIGYGGGNYYNPVILLAYGSAITPDGCAIEATVIC